MSPISNYSIFAEERLERLTKNIGDLDLESPLGSPMGCDKEETSDEESGSILMEDRAHSMLNGIVEISQSSSGDLFPRIVAENGSHSEHQGVEADIFPSKKVGMDNDVRFDSGEKSPTKMDSVVETQISEACDAFIDDFATIKPQTERRFPNAVLPLLRYQYESSESSSRYLFWTFSIISFALMES